jgi:hypothetical protein
MLGFIGVAPKQDILNLNLVGPTNAYKADRFDCLKAVNNG